ncbi:hypothetical protein CCMA1212_008804 [Trichoderma ghanense]|uniref:Uncharacterized protein n=1 Tax=Trichoderma ghanense TaxID=65468 RepID=A0ABY2GVM3_9HYPO
MELQLIAQSIIHPEDDLACLEVEFDTSAYSVYGHAAFMSLLSTVCPLLGASIELFCGPTANTRLISPPPGSPSNRNVDSDSISSTTALGSMLEHLVPLENSSTSGYKASTFPTPLAAQSVGPKPARGRRTAHQPGRANQLGLGGWRASGTSLSTAGCRYERGMGRSGAATLALLAGGRFSGFFQHFLDAQVVAEYVPCEYEIRLTRNSASASPALGSCLRAYLGTSGLALDRTPPQPASALDRHFEQTDGMIEASDCMLPSHTLNTFLYELSFSGARPGVPVPSPAGMPLIRQMDEVPYRPGPGLKYRYPPALRLDGAPPAAAQAQGEAQPSTTPVKYCLPRRPANHPSVPSQTRTTGAEPRHRPAPASDRFRAAWHSFSSLFCRCHACPQLSRSVPWLRKSLTLLASTCPLDCRTRRLNLLAVETAARKFFFYHPVCRTTLRDTTRLDTTRLDQAPYAFSPDCHTIPIEVTERRVCHGMSRLLALSATIRLLLVSSSLRLQPCRASAPTTSRHAHSFPAGCAEPYGSGCCALSLRDSYGRSFAHQDNTRPFETLFADSLLINVLSELRALSSTSSVPS